jgi:hypothetical protein
MAREEGWHESGTRKVAQEKVGSGASLGLPNEALLLHLLIISHFATFLVLLGSAPPYYSPDVTTVGTTITILGYDFPLSIVMLVRSLTSFYSL